MTTTPISGLRAEIRDWMTHERTDDNLSEQIMIIVERESGYLGTPKSVMEAMTEYDLWNDEVDSDVVARGDSVIDIARKTVAEYITTELEDEAEDFTSDCANGARLWCADGQHWYEDNEVDTCDNCGAEDCEDHGDVVYRDDVTDEDGNDDGRYLCEGCYRNALDQMERWEEQRKTSQVEREQEREAEAEAESRFERE